MPAVKLFFQLSADKESLVQEFFAEDVRHATVVKEEKKIEAQLHALQCDMDEMKVIISSAQRPKVMNLVSSVVKALESHRLAFDTLTQQADSLQTRKKDLHDSCRRLLPVLWKQRFTMHHQLDASLASIMRWCRQADTWMTFARVQKNYHTLFDLPLPDRPEAFLLHQPPQEGPDQLDWFKTLGDNKGFVQYRDEEQLLADMALFRRSIPIDQDKQGEPSSASDLALTVFPASPPISGVEEPRDRETA